ncbi:hypothetical protein LCGC14_1648430 [marine sediment metagenome]|uniref:Uncharacterized protein n=1 Tax=marine sediment metagenome TaxID=412755 RepID=A0A0F9HXH1_9ZZZZ
MKIKDLKGFPEKRDEKDFAFCDRLPVITFNQALDLVGEIEVELDVRKIEEILNADLPYLENSVDKIDRVHAEVMRSNNATSAQIIADNFKEVVK